MVKQWDKVVLFTQQFSPLFARGMAAHLMDEIRAAVKFLPLKLSEVVGGKG
jgi:hypothetical protein